MWKPTIDEGVEDVLAVLLDKIIDVAEYATGQG